MAECDDYIKLKSRSKIDLFTELFDLKAEKKVIEDKITELEKGYKEDVKKANKDFFFVLPNGVKFSIKKSTRSGNIDTGALELNGINVEDYRKPSITVFTLRLDT